MGGVILSLDIPLNRESCSLIYKEGTDHECMEGSGGFIPHRKMLCCAVSVPALEAECSVHSGICSSTAGSVKERKPNTARRTIVAGVPENSTRRNNTSWNLPQMGFPVTHGDLWECRLHSLSLLSSSWSHSPMILIVTVCTGAFSSRVLKHSAILTKGMSRVLQMNPNISTLVELKNKDFKKWLFCASDSFKERVKAVFFTVMLQLFTQQQIEMFWNAFSVKIKESMGGVGGRLLNAGNYLD